MTTGDDMWWGVTSNCVSHLVLEVEVTPCTHQLLQSVWTISLHSSDDSRVSILVERVGTETVEMTLHTELHFYVWRSMERVRGMGPSELLYFPCQTRIENRADWPSKRSDYKLTVGTRLAYSAKRVADCSCILVTSYIRWR